MVTESVNLSPLLNTLFTIISLIYTHTFVLEIILKNEKFWTKGVDASTAGTDYWNI